MKYLFLSAICLYLIPNVSLAQSSADSFINNLSNTNLDYEVDKVGRFFISDSMRVHTQKIQIEILSCNIDSLIKTVNADSLVLKLIDVLNDSKRDWYADAILYAITKKEAIPFIVIRTREEWVKYQKQRDIEYWVEYGKKIRKTQL